MQKFVTGKDLEEVITDIIWEAKDKLIILSPYIKLDSYFRRLFERQLDNPNLHIVIVFGKNEENVGKSLRLDDFDFFKRFPKVSIVYQPTLHAKYYGNEKKSVITSLNMYDHSFQNNIEFGVYAEATLLGLNSSTDAQAWDTSNDIANNATPVFIKRPMFKKAFLAFGKNYIGSQILLDETESFYLYKKRQPVSKKLFDFEDELEAGQKADTKPSREQVEEEISGFCIRTGVKIPFDPSKPYCADAYKSWAQYGNYDYQEKYCHKTGERSRGKTSMRYPILQQ